ncbi:MAG: leucine-rich repeat domain-containing protein, partial [Prevotella sp.]|nr:leucine-rich repeat domain-containing protein [Prevotella sp.]
MATRLFKSIHRKGLILAILFLSCFSYSVWGQDDKFTVDGITYVVTDDNNNYVSVSYTGNLPEDAVESTSENPGGYTATSYTIPSSVTYESTSYEVTGIGDNAFKQCYNVTSITLPNTVTSIGKKAFYHCTSLTEVKMANESEDTPYAGTVTSIDEQMCDSCIALEEFSVLASTDGITTIPVKAFFYCKELSSFDIPASVTTIATQAFQQSGIESADISQVTVLPNYVFYHCPNLQSVILSDNLTSIGTSVFEECTSLSSITTTEKTDPSVIPSSVTSIGYSAFKNCTALTAITIYSTDLDWEEYNNGDNINGNYAFYGCSSLSSVTLEEGLTSIGSYAFYQCSGLTEVTIPSTITEIKHDAFSGCSSLESLTWNAEICYNIGDDAFSNCEDLTTLTIGEDVTKIPQALGDITSLVTINYDAASSEVSFIDNEGSEKDPPLETSLFANCEGLTTVTVGENVTKLPDYLFADCTGITTVNTANTNEVLTEIGKAVFKNCTGIST